MKQDISLPPHDVGLLGLLPMRQRLRDALALLIDIEREVDGAYEGESLSDAHVHEGLSEVMEGFALHGFNDDDVVVVIAEGTAHGLSFR